MFFFFAHGAAWVLSDFSQINERLDNNKDKKCTRTPHDSQDSLNNTPVLCAFFKKHRVIANLFGGDTFRNFQSRSGRGDWRRGGGGGGRARKTKGPELPTTSKVA